MSGFSALPRRRNFDGGIVMPDRLPHKKTHCALNEAAMELLKFAMADMNLSARAYNRVLKVSRTIADLAGSERITSDNISEAIQYRTLDRQLWV